MVKTNRSFFLTSILLGAMGAFASPCDIIIRNARIIDGTGAPWYRGDIAIAEGKIAALGTLDPATTAPEVIDAADRYVSPGFVDVHTHCEGDINREPLAQNFIRMGVTTVILGNCGGSYRNLGSAFDELTTAGLGPNVASFVGHNTVRRAVMENANRDPSTTELLAMRNMVAEGMADGAVGLSTGLIYTPGTYAKTPEIVALAKEAANAGGIYASHMRSEGTNIVSAIEEALTIGREANIPVEISHFKVSSVKKHGFSTQTIAMVEEARAQGLDVTVDQYAYTASSTGISTFMPDEAIAGSRQEVRERLTNETTRSLIREELLENARTSGRPNYDYARVANFSDDTSINGKSILEIAREWKKDDSWEAQVDVILDIMTSGGASMVYHSMAEEDVQNIMKYPNTMIASDSGVRTFGKGVPHPRGYGNNARVLGLYTRDMKLLRLEDAIRKMTSLPARTVKLTDRGVLRPGLAADVVIFDLNNVSDPSTFQQPHAYAKGFDFVIVNGKTLISNGEITENRSGRILHGPGRR